MKTEKVKKQEQLICERLRETGKLTLAQAKELLKVSEPTVRRFFSNLEAEGRVVRIYGGIQQVPDSTMESYSFDHSKNRHIKQKKAIAAHAVSLVNRGDMIYVDSGTTLTYFSMRLSERLKAGELSDVTVVTNSLSNLNILYKCCNLLLVGGEFREHRRDFCGYLAEETLKSLRFTKCFLGSDGYSPGFGFTTTDFNTARLNEIVLDNSDETCVLIDTSKFYTSAAVSYSRSRNVDRVITEAPPPSPVLEELASRKTKITVCPEPDAS